MRRPNGVKASTYLAMRTELLIALREIDEEINKALAVRKSAQAFERAKTLFSARKRIVKRLSAEFGLQIDDHPAVTAHMNK